jgi:AcrR family transcriptional regulator
MNKRNIQKLETRNMILNKSKQLLYKYGLNKISTSIISQDLECSQGTLFLHFGTKQNLINELLISDIDLCIKDISGISFVSNRGSFVYSFIDVLSNYENSLRVVYKDIQVIGEVLTNQLTNLENVLKNKLLEYMRSLSSSRISIVDSFIVIDAFLSQIKIHLQESEYDPQKAPYLQQKKSRLNKLFNILVGDIK